MVTPADSARLTIYIAYRTIAKLPAKNARNTRFSEVQWQCRRLHSARRAAPRRAAQQAARAIPFATTNPPRMRVREKAEPSFAFHNAVTAPAAYPPNRNWGYAPAVSKEFGRCRERASLAGAIPARQGKGRYGENRRFSPVRMGSGVAQLAAGGKAFPPERRLEKLKGSSTLSLCCP